MSYFELEAFAAGAPRSFAELVANGDVNSAIAAGKKLPNGINTSGENGETALLLAVDRSNRKMVLALLKSGANPDGNSGLAPIALAVRAKKLSIANDLLKAGANPNGKMDNRPAIFVAAMSGRHDAIHLLVAAGADLEVDDGSGATAVIAAALTNNWATVVKLLDLGASLFVAQDNGVTLARYVDISRIRPDSTTGAFLKKVRNRFEAAGVSFPAPVPAQVRAMIANGSWPPN